MSDEISDGNPSDDAPGWAAPNSPTPPTPPNGGQRQPPAAPQNPTPYEPFPPQQNYIHQGESSQPFDSFSNPVIPQYSTSEPPKKKSKLWLWITLAVVIPLLLCGLGLGGCTVWFVGETKSATGAVNNFYKAVKDDRDLDPYSCADVVSNGSLKVYLDDLEENNGKVTRYDFKSYENTNGTVIVSGTVTRRSAQKPTDVYVVKEDGKYKVCDVTESPTP